MKSLYRDWSPFIAFVLLGICILLMFKRCDAPQPAIGVIPEMKIRDSFRTVIKYHDSTRVHYLSKWRFKTRMIDSSPCYTEVKTIIAECDTVIMADSVLISALKGQVSNDSVIIFKQSLMLKADSVYIGKLNKKVKRNRTIAKIAFITGLGLGGVVGVKIVQ